MTTYFNLHLSLNTFLFVHPAQVQMYLPGFLLSDEESLSRSEAGVCGKSRPAAVSKRVSKEENESVEVGVMTVSELGEKDEDVAWP